MEVIRLVSSDIESFSCSCEIYFTLLDVLQQKNRGQTEWDGISCLHIRFVKEALDLIKAKVNMMHDIFFFM